MRRLFPGDRHVWLAGAGVLAACLVVVAVYLARPGVHYTGTNSVGVRSLVAQVGEGTRLCIPELRIPEGTARAELTAMWSGERRPRLVVERRTEASAHTGAAQPPSTRPTDPPRCPS